MNRKLKETVIDFIDQHRLLVLMIFSFILFFILICRLFVLQIIQGEEHLDNFTYKIQKTITKNGIRGNIYDCNGKLLAYNKLAYTVTFQNDSAFAALAKQNKTTENEEKNKVIYKVIKILEENGDEIISDFPIKRTGKGKFEFTISGSELKTFKINAYGIGTDTSELSKDELKQREKQLNATAEEMYQFFKDGTGGGAGVGKMFDISDDYSEEDALKIMAVRYNVYLSRFSQYMKVTIASEINENSIAAIEEASDELTGIMISEDTMRVYNNSESIAHIVGYTGAASEDELKTLNEDKDEDDPNYYTSNDIVGKDGIEKLYESYLHGESGSETMLVDKIGKVLEVTDEEEPGKGNDVTLSIDSDLQKYCYDLIESKLAGIVLSKMTSGDSAGTSSDNKRIPIKEVYNALVQNKVIDIGSLNDDDSTKFEKSVYKSITNYQSGKLSALKNDLINSTKAHKDISEEKQAYAEYIYDMLADHKILLSSSIDTKDKTYKRWKSGEISLGEFLRYAINQEWIDTSEFNIKSSYYNTDEIFQALADYVVETLSDDTSFDTLVCEYMIKSGELSGKTVCRLLYEQGVLDKKKDKTDYNNLVNGSLGAYSFMRKKISDREITPGQLGLDPCSGSIIITDAKTGKIKTLVSYPSYDSNRLANGIDGDYYSQLVSNESRPLYDQALYHATAPGSTFKPLMALAALNEGIISSGTTVRCNGVFNKISPVAKCWIYPSSHGVESVSKAITDSCNVFFYEVGYKMGTTGNGSISEKQGLEIISKYATLLGLNKKSGIELSEKDPQVSDEQLVRTAIGQGTNNFAPIQIANYATTIANSGTVFDLSIMNKITDTKGKTVKKFEKKVKNKVKLKNDSYWNLVHSGMYGVVYDEHKDIFQSLKGVRIAGKTGTAQEDKKRPNHGLFISYGPYNDPEIAVTVVLPFAYTSSNACNVANDIYKYYFGSKKEKATLVKSVKQAGNAASGSSD
ncbi:MAG: penicillin-binding transpeptidase domain-containing protein [Lachnospiraceae bacterium]|nr:penicillin-binding transpeptidase domain-containing protein [Lachnospiraceae bacterium]